MAFAPALIPLIPTILGVGSAAVAGVSSLEGGNYQAAVARNNALIAERDAAAASEASQKEAARSDKEYAALIGEELAAQGASGLDVLGRTQVMTREAQARTGAAQAVDIRNQGTNQSRKFLQDAADYRAAGAQARTQGIIGAVGAGLSAAGAISNGFGGTKSLVTRGRKTPWNRGSG
jgi:hypothetical protein